ncbi:MAG: hypothetical protein L7F78_15865 [Syntrophales bacterium LBB04]|nr:hypothetical protein [Syntrophales bacterium LBB04]
MKVALTSISSRERQPFIDYLTIAPSDSLAVIIATSRYPNELIRMAKLVRRLGQTLIVITDSHICH